MNHITIQQLAYRIASRNNAVPRQDRDFTKSDFDCMSPLPDQIYAEFEREFPDFSREQEREFSMALNKFMEA